jgi:hypothetical protein
MLCARATLIAGPHHRRYRKGTLVRAVNFAPVESLDELQEKSFLGLAERGWRRMRIDGHAKLANDHVFPVEDSDEAVAFRAALDSGVGIVVLGRVQ